MTKDEALAKLKKARDLLDEVDGLMADVELACDEAGCLPGDEGNGGDVCGVVRDVISELENAAEGL